MVVAEAVGVAVEGEDNGAVQEDGGDGGAADDFAPGSDASVAGQDDGGLEVALGDDLEQAEAASADSGR